MPTGAVEKSISPQYVFYCKCTTLAMNNSIKLYMNFGHKRRLLTSTNLRIIYGKLTADNLLASI